MMVNITDNNELMMNLNPKELLFFAVHGINFFCNNGIEYSGGTPLPEIVATLNNILNEGKIVINEPGNA